MWDDAGHVTRPDLQSWSGLARIWFEVGATQQYYPLLHSAFCIEHRFWGDVTPGYHLINLLWHAIAAGLFVALLRRLAIPGAWLAGLLFALHPVCGESVAWIAEQKNTLSTVFYLAAALAWLRFEDERRPARDMTATLWFATALLTKTVTASLPAALLVIVWWWRGRLSWRGDVLPFLPWFVVGAGAGLFTAGFARTSIGAQGADFSLGARRARPASGKGLLVLSRQTDLAGGTDILLSTLVHGISAHGYLHATRPDWHVCRHSGTTLRPVPVDVVVMG